MRFRTIEIRWHDNRPISSCDFQSMPLRKARPPAGQEDKYATQSYRLATAGEDNHVRIWMVHPNIVVAPEGPRPPRVEYLATLNRHSAAVNVVRFSPSGDLIASAGDDGMAIIWAPSSSPQVSTYGSDLTQEDLLYEKEYWKPRTTFRVSTMQVYDLAWSPTGEYIITGSTDNTARVYTAADGKCVFESAEHTHYVQGVAWDPLNEYFATQSSDRSMHIYRFSVKQGVFEAHAIGKNTRMPHRHSRTPSATGHSRSRPNIFRRESITSDAESALSDHPRDKDDGHIAHGVHGKDATPLTPATSATGASALMFPPPPIDKPSSRRSSFSGSNAPGSPSTFSRYGRSPSPMPPLPAIRSLPSPSWSSIKLYGDDSFTNFFRRLSFSPDGALLLTPAGQFEDPSVFPGISRVPQREEIGTPDRGRKGRPGLPTESPFTGGNGASISSVYIYSRANFAQPPIAQLPGHKKASVAIRFSPVLYELRQGVEGPAGTSRHPETKTAVLEKGVGGTIDVDIAGPLKTGGCTNEDAATACSPHRTPISSRANPFVLVPSPKVAPSSEPSTNACMSPAHSTVDDVPPTAAESKPSTPITASLPPSTSSIFALPYRMLFAVLTMDTVAIYDTQQSGPICLLAKLHYDEFTDVTWSPDGQSLIISARDGYCTLIVFDDILPAHHTQQHALQFQSIAQHLAIPLSYHVAPSGSVVSTPAATPMSATANLPPSSNTPTVPKKRSDPPLTPAASTDGRDQVSYFPAAAPSTTIIGGSTSQTSTSSENNTKPEASEPVPGPPKKKRRVALTRVGDLGS